MILFTFKKIIILEDSEYFWRKQVSKSIQTISKRFMDFMNKARPEAHDNIRSCINRVEKSILKSTGSNLQQIVNMEVEKSLNIPENVILPTDRAQLKLSSNDEIIELENECENLNKLLIQNAIFVKHLKREIDSYKKLDDWLEKEEQICLRGQNYLNIQHFDTDFLNHDPTYNEIKEFN